jgi:glycosyltransferase involved in cell wall biosynthesis
MPAPIVLFAYKRADLLQRTLAALQRNHLAADSELYVYVDGPKTPFDVPGVAEVRRVVEQLRGFRRVHRHYAERNQGLANAIIRGVSEVVSAHGRAVILEDDIVTAPNFLDFVNQGLTQYEYDPEVFSIGGYAFPFERPFGYADDVFFYGRTCAWGWGIWADRWFQTDWNVPDFEQFMRDPARREAFNHYGSDRVRMLRRTMDGELDTWDIKLCYEQFKRGQLTVYPTVSKTENIGFHASGGSHTNVFNRYKTQLDKGAVRQFQMPRTVAEHPDYTRQFRHQFSVGVRAINRLKTIVGMR